MKFKLDENLGTRLLELFREYGHDVETVYNEGLQGCADPRLFTVCEREKRCLVTFDLDFGDIRHFPPEKTAGVLVVRAPENPSLELLERLAVEALEALKKYPIEKKLWVVEVGRIRIHQSEEEGHLEAHEKPAVYAAHPKNKAKAQVVSRSKVSKHRAGKARKKKGKVK